MSNAVIAAHGRIKAELAKVTPAGQEAEGTVRHVKVLAADLAAITGAIPEAQRSPLAGMLHRGASNGVWRAKSQPRKRSKQSVVCYAAHVEELLTQLPAAALAADPEPPATTGSTPA